MALPTRVDLLLAEQGLAVVLVAAVAGAALLAGAGYVYATPGTDSVTETTNRQQVSTEIGTSGVVTGNTSLYRPGERLTNMPVYLFSATPEITLAARTSVPQGESVSVTHRLTLVLEATRNGERFFIRERQLISAEHTVSNGSVADSTTVNMSRVRNEVGRIREEIGAAGSLTTDLRLVVEYRTSRYEGQLADTAPIQFEGRAFLLGDGLSASRTHSETVRRTVTQPRDVTTSAILGLAGLALIAGAAGLFRYRRELDVEELRTEYERTQYEEWISEGEFPTGPDNRFISIDSLEDLVDVAIDSEKRVIYESDLDAYAVVDGNVVYYFTTDPDSMDPWLDS